MLVHNPKSNLHIDVLSKEKIDIEPPKLYRVLLLNDDYTPMDFVVWVLIKVFHKSHEESSKIMLDTHNLGKGIVGVYSYDIARTKVYQTLVLAEQHEHPLQCIMEVFNGEENIVS